MMRDASRADERVDPAAGTDKMLRRAIHVEPWHWLLWRRHSRGDDRGEPIGEYCERLVVELREQRGCEDVHTPSDAIERNATAASSNIEAAPAYRKRVIQTAPAATPARAASLTFETNEMIANATVDGAAREARAMALATTVTRRGT
jgi:hypothetical protein